MVDFAALTQARQGLQKSDSLRHQQSTELYTEGRQLIREALGQPLDKTKLKQATECFSKGIQANYTNSSNYLGMGFLFLLLNQSRQALRFIQAGLELEPGSELGKELLQQAQMGSVQHKIAQKQNAPQLPQLDTVLEDIDFDDLYDSTAAAIMLFLKQIMSDEVLGFAPAPDPEQLARLQSRLVLFQTKTRDFYQRLQILDQEMDVNVLRMHLSQIEKALQRILLLSQRFEQFIHIHQDIQKHTDLTEGMIKASQSTMDAQDIPVLEENLQVLLDHCDSVADQLDDLEDKRVNISPLQPAYQQYLERLELFQDVLEETIDRIKTV